MEGLGVPRSGTAERWVRDREQNFAVLRRNNNGHVVVYEISELRGSRPARRKATGAEHASKRK